MSSEERRAPGMSRIPFEGLVEVGGALGPSFEAQAVNLCEDGMLMRTAYLPEAGQPLTCRFDTGGGQNVLASGEVVWTEVADKGGQFAIRFTDMDPESVDALKRLCGVSAQPGAPAVHPGSKVRLHIEGLASPMRAKIRDAGTGAVTVGSDLGFLQVGKSLDLEDAQSGTKRPASIDRVEVQVDPASNVPQLVVTLRYGDAPEGASVDSAADKTEAPRSAQAAPAAAAGDDLAAMEEAGAQMKGAFARNVARIGPAIERLAGRAKTTIALLAKKRLQKSDDVAAPRRTTAPPPGGGLHTAGKRVVRGEPSGAIETPPAAPRLQMNRRNAAIGGAVMIAAILGAIAIKKSHHEPTADAAAAAASATVAAADTATTPNPFPATPAQAPVALTASPPPFPTAYEPTPAPSIDESLASDDTTETPSHSEHHKHPKVTPFGNGSVHHGNILRLKMDGPIESIEGAQQPTGFAVKLPGRKSLEAAGPLAARDSRIAAAKVSNDSAGAELTLAFKDGVPHYQVMAKGDTLIIALAPAGDIDKVADKDDKGGKSAKHHKGAHGKAQIHKN